MLFQKIIIGFIFLFSINLYSQTGVKISGSTGYGSISGNIPDLTAFSFTAGIQFPSKIINDADINVELVWAKSYKYFFPSSVKKYYSSVTGISITAVVKQELNEKFFLEESTGYLFLYDNTYEFQSSSNNGINFNAALGINTDKKNPQSNAVLFGFNYGLTFTNNNTSFLITYLKYKITL